ncbi:hypothetical protein F5Y12DRAFT_794953 [Xylaria sp. FL1777]|nr:hypothetical protein F5Y12DRAFT_794953 [Xylaria sp. FL1777]
MSSTTKFQKYLEGMNRQLFDKEPGNQGSSILLPHQRRGPAQELKSRCSSISEVQITYNASQRGVVNELPDVPMNMDAPPRNRSSPEHGKQLNVHQNRNLPLNRHSKSPELQSITNSHQRQNPAFNQQYQQYQPSQKVGVTEVPVRINVGLAKSRWANLTYNGTPVIETSQPQNNYSTPIQSQQRTAVEKPAVTPVIKNADASMCWKLDQKHTSPVGDRAVAPKLASNVLVEQNRKTYSFDPNQPMDAEHSGWDDTEDVENHTGEQGLQLSTTMASAQVAEERNQATKKSTVPMNNIVPDSRANWPTKLSDLEEFGQIVARKKREFVPRSLKSSSLDEISSSTEGKKVVPRYVTDFIETWRQNAHYMETDFLSHSTDRHEDCDVNPSNGVLLEPVQYPATKRQELMSRSQLESTSTLLMRHFEAELTRRDPKRKALRKAEKEARAAARAAAKAAEPEASVEEIPNLDEVQTPCHLRPAVDLDIEAIAAIYNQEVADGYNAMDITPVGQEDFRGIYNQSLTEKMPFIVAVKGWYGAIDATHQEVIGFALITPVSRGIVGSYDTLSKCGGKLLVIVKPECRRKKIGTALMDIIITNCTGWHIPKGGYQFVNLTHDWISKEFGSNPRKWWYLEMEVMIRSAEDEEKAREGDEFQWIWNFLEAKFNLLLKHYDEKCFYQPHKMYWLDKLTFRRDCRTRGE